MPEEKDPQDLANPTPEEEKVLPPEEEEQETDAETDEEGDEEQGESEETDEETEEKPDPLQKRIAKLTAQKKEAEAQLRERDESLQEVQEEKVLLEKRLETIQNDYLRAVQKFSGLTYNDKPIVELSDKEFAQALKECRQRTDIDAERKLALISQAMEARERFQEEIDPVRERHQKATEKARNIWVQEWTSVFEQFPVDKSFVEKFEKVLQEQTKNDDLLEERLRRGGAREKFRYLLKVFEEKGWDKEIETSGYQADRPKPTAPVGVGTGPKAAKGGSKPPVITREFLRKCQRDPKLYAKYEAQIDEAVKAGRVH